MYEASYNLNEEVEYKRGMSGEISACDTFECIKHGAHTSLSVLALYLTVTNTAQKLKLQTVVLPYI